MRNGIKNAAKFIFSPPFIITFLAGYFVVLLSFSNRDISVYPTPGFMEADYINYESRDDYVNADTPPIVWPRDWPQNSPYRMEHWLSRLNCAVKPTPEQKGLCWDTAARQREIARRQAVLIDVKIILPM